MNWSAVFLSNPLFSRESYLPAFLRDVPPLTPSGTDLAIWAWEQNDKIYGIAFHGRAQKPLWFHRFGSKAARLKKIEDTIAGRKASLGVKEQRAEARKSYQHALKVGDVLYTSFGYNQTNIDFYEVLDVRGKSVLITKIGKKVDHSSAGGADYVVAVRGHYFGKPMLKRVGEYGVKVGDHYASPWGGRPVYETALGWGH